MSIQQTIMSGVTQQQLVFSVTPQYSNIYEGSTLTFNVTVSGNYTGGVNWQVSGGSYGDLQRFNPNSGTASISSGTGTIAIEIVPSNFNWGTTNFGVILTAGPQTLANSGLVDIYNISTYSAPDDYTIEWWQKMTSNSGAIRPFTINSYPNESLGVSYETTGTSAYVWETVAPPTVASNLASHNLLNAWHHIAVVRSAGTVSFYIDGSAINSITHDTRRIQDIANGLSIGSDGVNSNSYFTGEITNFRWTKGYSVYTGNFTPPTAPLDVLSAALAIQADTGGGDGNENYTAWKNYGTTPNESTNIPVGAIVTVADWNGHHGGTYTVVANFYDAPYQKISVIGSPGSLDTSSAMFNNAPFIVHWHEAKLLLRATDSGNVVIDSTGTHSDQIQGGNGISWASDTPFLSSGAGGAATFTGGPSGSGSATYMTYSDSRFSGLSDYTMECWFKPGLSGIYQGLFGFANDPRIEFDPSGIWGRADGIISSGNIAMPTLHSWHHIAVQRRGTGSNNINIYLDGSIAYTTTGNDLTSDSRFDVGYGAMGVPTIFNGEISQVRVSNIARYVDGSNVPLTTFTPATTPFTNDVNALLLLLCSDSGSLTSDSSGNPLTVDFIGISGTGTTNYTNTTGISNPETKLDIQNAAYIPGMFSIPIGATVTDITQSWADTVTAIESPVGETRFDRYFTLTNHNVFVNGDSYLFNYQDTSHHLPTFTSDNPFIGPLADSGSMVFDGVSRLHYSGNADWAIDTGIVTDGLILHLDATDTNSWPGSGSVWYDLSPSGANATMQTGTTPITMNVGPPIYLDFPGDSGSYFSTSISQQYVDYTVAMLPDFSYGPQPIGGTTLLSLFDNGSDYSMRFDGVTGHGPWVIVNPGNENGWAFQGHSNYVINGVSYSSSPTLSSGWNIIGGYRTNFLPQFYPSFTMRIGADPVNRGGDKRPFKGGIAVLLAYNRILSEAEQLQNFQALRTIVGI